MKAVESFSDLPDGWRCDEGFGVCYLLRSKTMFKIGATKRPFARISEQEKIGVYKQCEFVDSIYITEPMRGYKFAESALKRAGLRGLRFRPSGINGNSRPNEVFRADLFDLFRAALEAAEQFDKDGNSGAFSASLRLIERQAKGLDATTRRPRRKKGVAA